MTREQTLLAVYGLALLLMALVPVLDRRKR